MVADQPHTHGDEDPYSLGAPSSNGDRRRHQHVKTPSHDQRQTGRGRSSQPPQNVRTPVPEEPPEKPSPRLGENEESRRGEGRGTEASGGRKRLHDEAKAAGRGGEAESRQERTAHPQLGGEGGPAAKRQAANEAYKTEPGGAIGLAQTGQVGQGDPAPCPNDDGLQHTGTAHTSTHNT